MFCHCAPLALLLQCVQTTTFPTFCYGDIYWCNTIDKERDVCFASTHTDSVRKEELLSLLVFSKMFSHSEQQPCWVLYLTSECFFFLSFNEQLVLGVGMYLIPITPASWRAAFMPLHVYSGLLLFGSVIAVALMGITEKLIFGL